MNQSAWMRGLGALALFSSLTSAFAQIPDLVNALDAGGRSMGSAGAFGATTSDTLSPINNPAGLGYADTGRFGITFRNLPNSTQTVTGNFTAPTFQTSTGFGKRAVSHLGFSTPISNGSIGISYNVGGYIRDFRSGTNLANGALRVDNYREELHMQTDFITVAFGQNNGQSNWGFGLVVANNYVRNRRAGDLIDTSNNSNVGNLNSDVSGNGTGIGGVIGIQHTPESDPNSSLALSIRTPITLQSNGTTEPYYDRVPGKVSAGYAKRTGGFGNPEDYMIYGFQADYYFGGQSGKIIPRRNHLAFGGGVEYNFNRFNASWPIRIGFGFVPTGGAGYDERHALTFGLGYRPYSSKYSIDLNFASPTGGGQMDMSLGISYQVGSSR